MMAKTFDSKSLLTAVVLCGLLSAAALAQGPGMLEKGHVTKIEIAVWDAETHDELVQLQLGETLEVPAGRAVLLRLYAPRGAAPGDERKYLPVRFYVAKGNGAEVTAVDASKGLYQLTASRHPGVAEIRYELGEGITVERPFMRDHFFKVEVTGAAVAPTLPQPDPAWTKAQEMVARLYRGILMRDPDLDQEGVREWVQRLHRGGYPSLVEVAYEIAESQESQVTVPQRGYAAQDRLLAIYKHLLDLERSEIDRYQWQDHLAIMAEGGVTDVVMDIVRSPEFRRVHDYN